MPFVVGPEQKHNCAGTDTSECYENSYPGSDCKGWHNVVA